MLNIRIVFFDSCKILHKNLLICYTWLLFTNRLMSYMLRLVRLLAIQLYILTCRCITKKQIFKLTGMLICDWSCSGSILVIGFLNDNMQQLQTQLLPAAVFSV